MMFNIAHSSQINTDYVFCYRISKTEIDTRQKQKMLIIYTNISLINLINLYPLSKAEMTTVVDYNWTWNDICTHFSDKYIYIYENTVQAELSNFELKSNAKSKADNQIAYLKLKGNVRLQNNRAAKQNKTKILLINSNTKLNKFQNDIFVSLQLLLIA